MSFSQGSPADVNSGSATAVIRDVLHVTVAGATASTITKLVFDVGVQASVSGSDYSVDYEFSPLGNFVSGGFFYHLAPRSGPQISDFEGTVQTGPNGASASVVTYILGSNVDVDIYSHLYCSDSGGGSCDASGGQVGGYSYGLEAQPGVTFTSDSLDFPSVRSAAPEPAAWAMMLCGLGLVGGAFRHRSRRAARHA